MCYCSFCLCSSSPVAKQLLMLFVYSTDCNRSQHSGSRNVSVQVCILTTSLVFSVKHGWSPVEASWVRYISTGSNQDPVGSYPRWEHDSSWSLGTWQPLKPVHFPSRSVPASGLTSLQQCMRFKKPPPQPSSQTCRFCDCW